MTQNSKPRRLSNLIELLACYIVGALTVVFAVFVVTFLVRYYLGSSSETLWGESIVSHLPLCAIGLIVFATGLLSWRR